MININQLRAGLSKKVNAEFLGDNEMTHQAKAQCCESLAGVYVKGTADFAYKLILDNILANHEYYGDTNIAESHINLDIELPELTSRPKWCVN